MRSDTNVSGTSSPAVTAGAVNGSAQHSTSNPVVPRILMAEDNAINQRVGKLILQRAGFVIDVVQDGQEALQAHKEHPYELILMDVQMPIMDGFEACRQIRKLPIRQPVIVAVTANALLGERERCLDAGMDDYLSKPFQAEQLIGVVEKWLGTAPKDSGRDTLDSLSASK